MTENEQPTTRSLGGGVDIPMVGFGTYLIDPADTADAVAAAIDAGYRHIDTAEAYQNEREVGEGIRRGLEANGLAREDLFVTTKLWPGDVPGQTKSADQVQDSLDHSLELLGLDHVDLYLIHRPVDQAQRVEQWTALVQARQAGKARAVGVSNFNTQHLEDLVAAGLPTPQADQVELHPWSQKPELVAYLDAHDIVPIAYSSLAPLSTWRHAPGHGSGKTDAMRAEGESANSPFKRMAAKYGVSEAQLLLRWGVQKGYPILPKSTNPERMRQNRDLFGFRIDDADMAEIATMDRGDGLAWGPDDPTHSA